MTKPNRMTDARLRQTLRAELAKTFGPEPTATETKQTNGRRRAKKLVWSRK